MTHFARFFKCFRRPDLCPFGNNNNSNKIFIGTVRGAFVLHYLLILGISARQTLLSHFQMRSLTIRQIKKIHTRQMGALDYWDYSPSLAQFTAG